MKEYQVMYDEGLKPERGNPLTDFSFPWRKETCPPTRFGAVWNAEIFSFVFVVEDADLVLAEVPDPGQAALGSDRVELFFASSPDLTTPYYGAEMDPAGRVYDYAATFYREIDSSWSFSTLSCAGTIGGNGYELSGQIQLEELRDLGLLVDGKMTTGVYRAEFSHREDGSIREDWISWIDPGTAKPDFHVPSSFGQFRFVEKS